MVKSMVLTSILNAQNTSIWIWCYNIFHTIKIWILLPKAWKGFKHKGSILIPAMSVKKEISGRSMKYT